MRKEIGRGGYGVVYSEGDNAIKKFKRPRSFLIESVNCSVFSGKQNIIQAKKFDQGRLEITFPLCDTDLHNWNRKTRPENLKVSILMQICRGLCQIHDEGKVHCDLKPANILLKIHENDIEAFIGDLGLLSNRGSFCNANYCTRFYREKNVVKDLEHDIFSFGIIFLCLLSCVPVKKSDLFSYSSIRRKTKDIMNKKLSNLTCRMLDKDINRRPNIRDIYYILTGNRCPKTPFKRSIELNLRKEKHRVIVNHVDKAFDDLEILKRDDGTKRRRKKFEAAIAYYISTECSKIVDRNIAQVVSTAIIILKSLFVGGNCSIRKDNIHMAKMLSNSTFCSILSMC